MEDFIEKMVLQFKKLMELKNIGFMENELNK
jgi:hypothetical protein